jgi:hypothetical protein
MLTQCQGDDRGSSMPGGAPMEPLILDDVLSQLRSLRFATGLIYFSIAQVILGV